MTKEKEVGAIESLLKEKRIFRPPKEFLKNSNIALFMKKHGFKNYEELLEKARKKSDWFWQEMVREVGISWQKKPKKILEWKWPYAKWFVGAKYNIVIDALDKHAKERPDKIAYIWESEQGETRKISYKELYEETCRLANALKELGVKKGDRVAIWLPMIPELPIAMLASAKIGAIHSVVFSGFSEHALENRINDAKAKVLITADGYWRNGKIVELKNKADSILKNTPIKKVVIVRRIGKIKIKLKKGRDYWWHEIIARQKPECKTRIMDANDILFILYTSGTTGKPKGIIHVHAGYAVGIAATMKFIFDIKPNDIWWCTADIGWITGHSYVVYAPLMLGVTSVMYEGSPTWPNPSRWWKIIDKYRVSVFYTAPTAIRMFMKFGEKWIKPYKLDSLRLLGTVGEPINPEAWVWYWKYIGKEKCPIMNTWWQTETGMQIISPMPIIALKPGSAFKPFPTIEADVFDEKGMSLRGKNKGGYLVLKTPWPAMLHGVWRNPKRYFETYWEKFKDKKVYLTGDAAKIDKDGYFWIQGRLDDVIKVAGHRIGNAEVESALVSHPAVSEAAVIGKAHEIKGEIIVAFVILKKGIKASEKLKEELKEYVAKKISKIAKPELIYFVPDLPKTRSGKIMRRVIKAILLNNPLGDISTLANPQAIDEVKKIIS